MFCQNWFFSGRMLTGVGRRVEEVGSTLYSDIHDGNCTVLPLRRPQVQLQIHSPNHIEYYSIRQKKRARKPVPICPCKLLEPATGQSARRSCLKGKIRTGLHMPFF